MNKQVLAFTLFVRNSSPHVYNDCSMKKQPISTAVVFEFSELLNELPNHIENSASYLICKYICHCDRFIFYISL